MYQIANEAQDFQYKREVCPSVWLGNMEIDETTDQEIANLYQQVFKENPEHSLPEVILNEELWERTQQIRIEESIMRRKLKCIGHTLRKPENNITRCALEWNPRGSRRRGRPKQSWKRSVIAELARNKIT